MHPNGSQHLADLATMPTTDDPAPANGSSIAVLAEFSGNTVLLAGDAHPDILVQSIAKLATRGRPLRLDLFKLSHHGNERNTTETLIELIDCNDFLVSTSGAGCCNPDRPAIARAILGAQPIADSISIIVSCRQLGGMYARAATENPDILAIFPLKSAGVGQ